MTHDGAGVLVGLFLMVVFFVFILAIVSDSDEGLLSTSGRRLWRAKRDRRRRMQLRAAELIDRGLTERDAADAADREMQDEARKVTDDLRKAGVPDP